MHVPTAGLIVFNTEEAAKQAALLPVPIVQGRQVEVERPVVGVGQDKSAELYLWNLPASATESDLRGYYADAGLRRMKFKMNANYATSVGVAFVGFESPEAALQALQMGPPEIRGTRCGVKLSGYQGDKEVCLKGSLKLNDEVVRRQYEAFGPDAILSIKWQHDLRDGKFLGQGFVCFKTAELMSQVSLVAASPSGGAGFSLPGGGGSIEPPKTGGGLGKGLN